MSAGGGCPLSMSGIGRFFHNEFIVVHSRLQLFILNMEVSAIRAVRWRLYCIKFRFTCGQVSLYLWRIKLIQKHSKFKNIKPFIVRKFFVCILRRL